jgi:hypothetical protein
MLGARVRARKRLSSIFELRGRWRVGAHRQDREKRRFVRVTFVGSLQPFAPFGATTSSEAHFVRASAHQAQALDLDQSLRPHLLVAGLEFQARLLFDPPLAPVARQAPAEDDEPTAQTAHGLGVSSNNARAVRSETSRGG